jgi:hypothetical protein
MVLDWKTIRFTSREREDFRTGGWRQWQRDFPMLFDLDGPDQTTAANQIPNGLWFYEWLTARNLFENNGYHSFVEAYYYRNLPPLLFRSRQPLFALLPIEEFLKSSSWPAPFNTRFSDAAVTSALTRKERFKSPNVLGRSWGGFTSSGTF